MEASLEERANAEIDRYRQPQDTLIEILDFLRGVGEANKTKVAWGTNTTMGSMPPYLNYLREKGLVNVREGRAAHYISITQKGRDIPLEDISFADFTRKGKRRTKVQIERDIADAIYINHGATKYQIMSYANTSGNGASRYLDAMVASGYLEKTTVRTRRSGMKEGYKLTPKGASRFPDRGDKKSSNEYIGRGRGDSLARLLEVAQNGANKTGLMHLIGTNTRRIEQYIACLLEYRLLEQSDNKFFSTPLYGQIDKAVLPYVLDIISTGKQRTSRLLELDFLLGMSMLISRNELFMWLRMVDGGYYGRIFHLLTEKGYASSSQEGTSTMYQITPEGESFIAKVRDNLAILANAVQMPLSYNTISVKPLPP